MSEIDVRIFWCSQCHKAAVVISWVESIKVKVAFLLLTCVAWHPRLHVCHTADAQVNIADFEIDIRTYHHPKGRIAKRHSPNPSAVKVVEEVTVDIINYGNKGNVLVSTSKLTVLATCIHVQAHDRSNKCCKICIPVVVYHILAPYCVVSYVKVVFCKYGLVRTRLHLTWQCWGAVSSVNERIFSIQVDVKTRIRWRCLEPDLTSNEHIVAFVHD